MKMDQNLADLVGAIAAAMPDRCALVCDGERLSYPELMARSSQVAQHLIGAGVEPDETVGLYLLNSVSYIEALLGCMLARAMPVNINYRYTGNELAHLFSGAALAALVVDAEHAPLAASVASGCPSLRHVLIVGTPGEPVSFPAAVTVADYAAAVGGRAGPDARQRPQRRRQADHLHRRHHRAAEGRALAPRGLLLLRARRREPLRPAPAVASKSWCRPRRRSRRRGT